MISVHHYSLGGREGALLRVDGGYCDLHPWPELGDHPLRKQLDLLKEGSLTPLTKNALEFARIDAEARREGQSLFYNLTIPMSHYLVRRLDKNSLEDAHNACKEGFCRFKVKLGKHLKQELPFLKPLLEIPMTRWRLDFNLSLTSEGCRFFLSRDLNFSAVEFCEDPMSSPRDFPLPIACDRHEFQGSQYRIIKPAVDDWRRITTMKNQVFTTYLGHPLGQAADAWAAGIQGCREICGLLSHRVYPKNPFSECLSWDGPEWVSPEGSGFGFDYLLHHLKWQLL